MKEKQQSNEQIRQIDTNNWLRRKGKQFDPTNTKHTKKARCSVNWTNNKMMQRNERPQYHDNEQIRQSNTSNELWRNGNNYALERGCDKKITTPSRLDRLTQALDYGETKSTSSAKRCPLQSTTTTINTQNGALTRRKQTTTTRARNITRNVQRSVN